MTITERIDSVTKIAESHRKAICPAPKSIKIEISPRCPLRCEFCSLKTRETQPREDMDFRLFQRITREMREAGVEEAGVFYIGESFSAPRLLVDCIKWCKDLGFPYVFLTSNASLARPEWVEECMKAGLDSLKWSVNAGDEEQYKKLMCVSPKYFRRALANIREAWYVRQRGGYQTGLYASSMNFPLSEWPDGYNRNDELQIAQLAYANAIGCDPQDINPALMAKGALGVGAQAVVLSEKAAGFGVAARDKHMTHIINKYILPASVTFAFQERDLREEKQRADIGLVREQTRASMITTGEITAEQARQMAVDSDDMPREFIAVDQTQAGAALNDEEKPVTEEQVQAMQPAPDLTQTPAAPPQILGLVAGRCRVTGQVYFRPSRLSHTPGAPVQDTQDPYPLAERLATVLSWSAESLSFHMAPPHHYGQVDFDGGGRILMEFTDVAEGEVSTRARMEMVFRIKDRDELRGFKRYFWKATPVRTGSGSAG